MQLKNTVLVAVVAMILGACGSTGEVSGEGVASLENGGLAEGATASDTTVPEAESVDREQALLDFASCMRDNGVDMADPTVDADGNVHLSRPGGGQDEGEAFDREAIQAAREACGEFLEGTQLGFEGGDITELQDTMLEYAQCMRDNGFDMADPDFSNFGPGGGGDGEEEPGQGGPFGGIDRDDPEFITAQAACEDILAGFGPGGGGGLGRGQN